MLDGTDLGLIGVNRTTWYAVSTAIVNPVHASRLEKSKQANKQTNKQNMNSPIFLILFAFALLIAGSPLWNEFQQMCQRQMASGPQCQNQNFNNSTSPQQQTPFQQQQPLQQQPSQQQLLPGTFP